MSGFRPGTGQQRLGTGMRPGSGRLGTGRLGTGQQAAPVYTGVGLNTNIQVQDRPVTQQGMKGMRPGSAGPGRQVQDVSYWTGVLRTRISEVSAEIDRLKQKIGQTHKDTSTYAQLERKYETLIKEVRNLEGNLADYNLAMDKSRTGTDPREIDNYYLNLRRRNEQEAKQIDKTFVERQEKERAMQGIDNEISRMRERADEKMRSLPESQYEEYQSLLAANERQMEEIMNSQSELEQINAQINDAEDEVARDRFRDEAVRLEKQIQRVRRERDLLQEEVSAAQVDPTEARRKLMEKVKADGERMKEVKAELQEQEAQNEAYKQTIQKLSSEIEQRQSDNSGAQKYELLYQRDREMTEFIENFDTTRQQAIQEKQQLEHTIVALLEHVSQEVSRRENLPTQDQVKAMGDDLDFKGNQLERAKNTQDQLQAELKKRKEELAKVESLDSKIAVELSSLKEKMRTMTDEMAVFRDLDMLKRNSEVTKEALQQMREDYKKRKDAIKAQAQAAALEFDRVKAQLASNETHKKLDELERRLQQHEQSIFSTREYIETKGKEGNYQVVRTECMTLTDEINAMQIKQQSIIQPGATVQASPY